ncbi:phosphotransferase, partial [Candidatus Sumerlaeota bacterium]|nr:phosphotransferase [Candidatus Sumerlaeota bacterium]
GNWRDGPEVTPEVAVVLEQVEATVRQRLKAFGKGKDRYGLMHADMRLANLLVDDKGTRLIDFDDCGMGWFLYDFATGISFIEDNPLVPAMKASWVKGYRQIRDLGDDVCRRIDRVLKRSIRYSLDHREVAVEHALQWGRGLDRAKADRFIEMYVNDLTLNMGGAGRPAIEHYLARAAEMGLIPDSVRAEFVR